MKDATCKDFTAGDIVRHVFHGRVFVVRKVGRKYLHCILSGDTTSKARVYRFLPTSVTKLS